MNDRYVLKDLTKSFCPHCYREIPASIIEKCDGVYMQKSCPDHGSFRAMIEKDASIYKTLMNHGSPPRQPMALVIPITHRCNLRCKMCFLPDDGVPDPSRKAIFRLIDNFEGTVVFSGGEPTLRDDLPELIAYATKQGKHAGIVTNGLRLREKKLVKRMADAGLNHCVFSMNGLSDIVFEQIDGQPLFQKKLTALENLQGTSIKLLLSTTMISGVNTEELPGLADFYMTNRDLFFGWRLRPQVAIGKHTDASGLWMSDMLNLVCRTLDVDREKLLKSIDPEQIYHGTSHLYFDILSTAGDSRRMLGYRTVVWRSYKVEGVGFQSNKPWSSLSLSQKIVRYASLFWRSNRNLSASMSLSQKVVGAFYRLFQPSRLRWYHIQLFAWPDVYNVDLEEINQTGIHHIGPGGKPMPFVKAIILNNGMPDWNWE
jgi:hypothetical protein